LKKRKVSAGSSQPKSARKVTALNTKTKEKERASERKTIPIPESGHEDDAELDEEDLEMLEEYGGAAGFLSHLDKEGIARYAEKYTSVTSLTICKSGARRKQTVFIAL
jgi:nucleolar complex protein 3